MAHLLYLVHDLPPREQTGTPLFAHGYARSSAERGWRVTVATPTLRHARVPRAHRLPGESFTRLEVPPSAADPGPGLSRDARWSIEAAAVAATPGAPEPTAIERLLRHLAPDLLHIVDNVHGSLCWGEIAHDLGIPVIRTVASAEDLCGLVTPISPGDAEPTLCAPPLTPAHCASCIRRTIPDYLDEMAREMDDGAPAPLEALLQLKRARTAHTFTSVYDHVIFPSGGFGHFFEATLPLTPGRAHVVPMGVDPPGVTQDLPRADRDRGPVTFAVAGTWHHVKGTDLVVRAFTDPRLRDRNDWRLRMLGTGDPRLVEPLAAMPQVELHGSYAAVDLPGLLADADVGISASRFETFHRVTREYLLAGLPVVGSRAFGIPDVVHDGRNGVLFDTTKPDDLVVAITRLLDDRVGLGTLTAGARATHVRTTAEEGDELEALYQASISEP